MADDDSKRTTHANVLSASSLFYTGTEGATARPDLRETKAEVHIFNTHPGQHTTLLAKSDIDASNGSMNTSPADMYDPEIRPDSGLETDNVSNYSAIDLPPVKSPSHRTLSRTNRTSPYGDLPPQASTSPILTVTKPAKVEEKLPGYLEASQAPSRVTVVIKWLVIILSFSIFLACIVFSKLSVIHMTRNLLIWNNQSRHDTASVPGGGGAVFLMILITIMIPYGLTLVRSVWCGAFRSDRPWPSKHALVLGVLSSLAESAGITMFTLDILPNSPSYIGPLLMNGVFLIPIMCQMYFSVRRHNETPRSESRCFMIVLVMALIFALAGLALTAYFEIGFRGFHDHKLLEIPLSILLLSFAWCPLVQKAQLDPPLKTLEKLVQATKVMSYSEEAKRTKDATELHVSSSTNRTLSMTSTSSSASGASDATGPGVDHNDPGNISFTTGRNKRKLPNISTHPQFSSRWKITIITSFLKLLFIPGFSFLYVYLFKLLSIPSLLKDLHDISTTHPSFPCFMISIFTSFGGYLVGWAACVMGIHKAAFTVPLMLSTPLAVALIMIPQSCNLVFHHLHINCQLDMHHRPEITIPAAFCLYISQVLSVGFFLLKTVTIVMPKESQIFWMPGYNSIFLEQHLLLSRKNKQTDEGQLEPSAKAQKTRVYICTTMYRESAREMEQLLKSYARVNRAKQWSDRHFQALIFLDNGVRGTRLTSFALQLVSIVRRTLGVTIQACTKVATPYGMTLSWLLPSEVKDKQGMFLTVHLKDNCKVKNKKRWSQIMYMSYVLDYAMREHEQATDEDSFILTTDADIQFAPGSVEALLDLMTRDPTVGAVCSRTHPMGSGPVYWYQIFDYAIGHWLQKAANHVLGSVLCCPGCFSVFRVAALRDVIPTYATNVTQASEFLTKDMGEDRWLCTLMVQAGWRLDYCAAAENSTYVPEEFDEYFKQRRRWIPSSLANQVLMMQEWITIYYFNKQISLSFILYQGILLVSSLLNPSVSIVIIVGGLYYAWGVHVTISMIILLIVTCVYTWICLSTSQELQLKVAKFLTIAFSMVMAAVVIGTAVKLKNEVSPDSESTTMMPSTTTYRPHSTTNHSVNVPLYAGAAAHHYYPDLPNSWLISSDSTSSQVTPALKYLTGTNTTHSPLQAKKNTTVVPPGHVTTEVPTSPTTDLPTTSIYFFGIVAIFVLTALMHLDEFYCILHGLWYLLGLPAGNLILTIYSLCNMTDRSWGTREEKKAVRFGDVTNWKESLKTVFKKVFFCYEKRADDARPAPVPVSGGVKRKPESSSRMQSRHTEEHSRNEQDDDDHDPQWWTSSGIERRHSFRFHGDNVDAGPITVNDWLPSNFRTIYAPLFMKKGYDDTSFLSGITEADVAAVGIISKAHIGAIMSAIKLLPEMEIQPCVPEDAEEWLLHIGLQQYSLNFRRSHILTRIHLEILRSMSKQDIEKELNITKPGHLRRLKLGIDNLRYPTKAEEELQDVKCEIGALPWYDLKEHGPREYDFWEALRKRCLMPESIAFAHDLDLKEKLTELRNSVLLLFAVANTLWLILITTLVSQKNLNVLGTTGLDLGFLVVFGSVLVIQFVCMCVHRVSTWMHVIARTPLRCGDPYNSTWSWGELTKSKAIIQLSADPEANRGILQDSVDVSAALQKRQIDELANDGFKKRVSALKTGRRSLIVLHEHDDDDVDEHDDRDTVHLLK